MTANEITVTLKPDTNTLVHWRDSQMFEKDQAVKVFMMFPGQYEPLWHSGVIVEKTEGCDTYLVKVEGSLDRTIKTTDIRKVD